MDKQELISIGFVKTSYGVKGCMKVSSYSGETRHFKKLKMVYLRKDKVLRQFRVESVSEQKGDILLKLSGLESPEAAKIYSTWDVVVPREFAAPLKEGEFYYCDLIGSVLLKDKTEMGTVRSVVENGASFLLEVECAEADVKGKKKVVLVPFLEQFIGEVDAAAKTIELKETWFFE
ncbi:MAG: ribosome maturation factor RimM [Spirochaetia bacterium]|nr:ribosome maturation factor RimM [Spirochaetia bacterium]